MTIDSLLSFLFDDKETETETRISNTAVISYYPIVSSILPGQFYALYPLPVLHPLGSKVCPKV
jgi:hypothetical protein